VGRRVVAALVVLGLLAIVVWRVADGTRARRDRALPPDPVPQVGVPLPADVAAMGNVLLVILDDIGQDMLDVYGLPGRHPSTPTLDGLARRGVVFRQVVANPVCSPTRATLLTGQPAWMAGVGTAIPLRKGWDLDTDRPSLARIVEQASGGRIRTAAVGKWHLATPNRGGWDHPRRMGFDHQRGTMGNLLGELEGTAQSYFRWLQVEDGRPSVAEGYVTSRTVDDALSLARGGDAPFLLWVAFHAAHYPMHAPPRALLRTPLAAGATEADLYRAMIEALDTELGRLLDGLGPEVLARTLVVVVGDNGSAPAAVEPPFDRQLAKGTLARGGTQVPLLVAGPGVAEGATSSALVSTQDVLATVVEWLGVRGGVPPSSTSFLDVLRDPSSPGRREVAYAERFAPNGPPETWTFHEAVARDARHKLLVRNGAEIGLFDLVGDPMETRNLFRGEPTPELRAALNRLRAAIPAVAKVRRSGERAGAGGEE
jgi:arylsulfatase A-like enzyme